MRKHILVVTTAMVLVLALATMAMAQQATCEDFKEYIQISVGRWVGEVTWVTDWPGLGKKGDKVTCYSETRITEDGNALINKFYGGNGSGSSITVYDAAAKQIRESGVDSGGTVGTNVYFKEGGKWVEISTGSLADGRKTESKSTVAISNNGNTQIWTGTGTIGGKKVDDQHDVWRRVSK